MVSILSARKLVLATALMGAMTGSALAYTAEQEQLCTGDAMRLCSAYIPDVDSISTCMQRQYSQLSPGCKSVFRPMAEPTRGGGKPTNLSPARQPGRGI
jgi:hypothetical protein